MLIDQLPGVHFTVADTRASAPVTSGVPVFIGRAGLGNANQLKRFEFWRDFNTWNRAVPLGGLLGEAVRGFFQNGGRRCYAVGLGDTMAGAIPHAYREALAAVAANDDVDLVCAPDLAATIAAAYHGPEALDHLCEAQRILVDFCDDRGDCFAILDCLPNASPDDAAKNRDALVGSSNAALYYPWLLALPHASAQTRSVPPCGHVAGLFANTDRPPGTGPSAANRRLEGVVDVMRRLNPADQQILAQQNVNPILAFSGRGLRVWGERTIGADERWRLIPVRRLFIDIGRRVKLILTALMFEPNNDRLWIRVIRELTAYLAGLYRSGLLQGASAQDAFFVKCDAETNPPAGAGSELLGCAIGFKPAGVAEFIVVRMNASSSGIAVVGLT